jgi:hypothetical protein
MIGSGSACKSSNLENRSKLTRLLEAWDQTEAGRSYIFRNLLCWQKGSNSSFLFIFFLLLPPTIYGRRTSRISVNRTCCCSGSVFRNQVPVLPEVTNVCFFAIILSQFLKNTYLTTYILCDFWKSLVFTETSGHPGLHAHDGRSMSAEPEYIQMSYSNLRPGWPDEFVKKSPKPKPNSTFCAKTNV